LLTSGFAADHYFYKLPQTYVLDESENFEVIYDRMGQELYKDIVRFITPLNPPLMHMAMVRDGEHSKRKILFSIDIQQF
jgi:hypothetical protein